MLERRIPPCGWQMCANTAESGINIRSPQAVKIQMIDKEAKTISTSIAISDMRGELS